MLRLQAVLLVVVLQIQNCFHQAASQSVRQHVGELVAEAVVEEEVVGRTALAGTGHHPRAAAGGQVYLFGHGG